MVENVMALISQLSHSDWLKVTLTATLKQHATASAKTQNRLSRPHLDAVTSIHQLRRRTQRPGISSCHQSCQLHHLIIAPSTHHKTARNSDVVCHQSHYAIELEQVSTLTHPDFSSLPMTPRVPQHQTSMIIFNRLPDSSEVRSELSQTDKASNGSLDMSQIDSAHTC